jgi:hypothetical protein
MVKPAKRSPAAERKALTKQTAEGMPVHSFQTLLADLATLTINRVQPAIYESARAVKRCFFRGSP